MIFRYVDSFQNTYWFREDPKHLPTNTNHHYGIILKIKSGILENSRKSWKIGSSIAIPRSICEIEEDPNIVREIFCGIR